MTELLTIAKDIAARAHAGQKDRFTGEIYYTHPMRLAAMVAERGGSEFDVIGAILHDVLEDCPSGTQDAYATEILLRFGPAVLRVCSILSRKPDETYMEYIVRTAKDPTTRLIKECDLDDHLDYERLENALPYEEYVAILAEYEGLFKRYETAKKIIKDLPVPKVGW